MVKSATTNTGNELTDTLWIKIKNNRAFWLVKKKQARWLVYMVLTSLLLIKERVWWTEMKIMFCCVLFFFHFCIQAHPIPADFFISILKCTKKEIYFNTFCFTFHSIWLRAFKFIIYYGPINILIEISLLLSHFNILYT